MEPVDCANRWHQWSVQGTGEVLTRALDHLDSTLPCEWKRLCREELQPFQSFVRPGAAWYSLARIPSHAGVTLSLERLRDSELRGGRVWFAGPLDPPPPLGIPAAWDQIMRFLDERIVPAARAVGASVWVPTTEELFLAELPPDVSEHLRKFSLAARKLLPLNSNEAELWRSFVIGAFRAKAVLDARRFVDWLVQQGWEWDTARELNLRFFDECQLLMRYAEEVAAA